MEEIKIQRKCPYCGGDLSDIRTDGQKYWQHCNSCNFEFSVDLFKGKIGHWIKVYDEDGCTKDWVCDRCGQSAITNEWLLYDLSPYCPHCGAKMEYQKI